MSPPYTNLYDELLFLDYEFVSKLGRSNKINSILELE